MSLEQLKLNNSITKNMLEAGYYTAKEIQLKTVSRILGGQNILALAPEGSGKTTAFVIASLMRLKSPSNGAPRALVLTATKDKSLALVSLYNWLGKNTGLRSACLTGGLLGDQYMEALEDGQVDILICTPDKLSDLYGKALLNLRSLMMIVVDDADIICKSNQLATLYHLFEGQNKCQKIFMTDSLNEKLERLAEQAVQNIEFVEKTSPDEHPEFIPMIAYNTSNYKTKINFLEQLLRDPKFTKAALFVNSKDNAQTLYSTLKKRVGKAIGLLYVDGIDSLDTFKQSGEVKAIILNNDDQPSFNLSGFSFIVHIEIPSDKSIFLKRITKIPLKDQQDMIAITLATQPEMETVKKIEQTAGIKIKTEKLPQELTSGNSSSNETWNWKIV